MAARRQDCRTLALIAHRHGVTEECIVEMQEAVADTASRSVQDTLERLLQEYRATRPAGRCKACDREAPLVDGECPDCRH